VDKALIALTPYLAMWNVEQNLRAEPESLEEGLSQHWSLAEASGRMGCRGCCSLPAVGDGIFSLQDQAGWISLAVEKH